MKLKLNTNSVPWFDDECEEKIWITTKLSYVGVSVLINI